MALGLKMTRVETASPEAIAAAAACLRAGGLVAMPTETVYGLAADATSDEAVAAIYAAKERPAINPLIAHVLDIEAAREHGLFGADAETLARAFWPGPLTLVVPAAPTSRISLLARAGLDSVAIRAPSHETARALIEAAGVPLAAPSANRSGRVSPTTAAHVARRSRRQGRLHPRRRAMPPWPRIRRSSAVLAPGPNCCVRERSRGRRSNWRFERRSSRAGARATRRTRPGNWRRTTRRRLRFGSARPTSRRTKPRSISAARSRAQAARARLDLSPSGDLVEAASHLFSYLRALDAAGPERIAVAPIPEHGLGAAINDRLRRAAAPRGTLNDCAILCVFSLEMVRNLRASLPAQRRRR